MSVSKIGWATANPTGPASVNVTLPTQNGTPAANDVCTIACIGEKTRTALPSGFTQIDFNNTNGNEEGRSSWKLLSPTDISNGFVTIPGDPNFNGIRYEIWIDRVTGTAAIDATAHSMNQASPFTSPNTIHSITGATLTTSGAQVNEMTGGRPLVGATGWTSPSTDISTVDHSAITGFLEFYSAHFAQAASPVPTETVTASGSANATYVSILIAVVDTGTAGKAIVAPPSTIRRALLRPSRR